MKKNYNIPATEVIALVSGMIMQTVIPTTTTNPTPNPDQTIPGTDV